MLVIKRWSPGVSFAPPPLTFVASAAQCRFCLHIRCCVLLRGVPWANLATMQRRAFLVVGPSAWNDLPIELRSLLMTRPSKFYISLKSFFFGHDWAGSAI